MPGGRGGAFTLVSDGMHVGMSGTFCVVISGPCPSYVRNSEDITTIQKRTLFPSSE